MYKIVNTDVKDGKVHLAESGLYTLMENEVLLTAVAQRYVSEMCDTFERNFNAMVEAAVADYPIFLANIGKNATRFQLDVLGNFGELFDYAIDIKKKEQTIAGNPTPPAKNQKPSRK